MTSQDKTLKDLFQDKIEYINDYIGASNAATASKFDQNSNITSKSIAGMATEIWKDLNIGLNRTLMHNKITEIYGLELADEYLRQIEDKEIYCHDESSLNAYCASISLYPFLLDGLNAFNGISDSPKHLSSFCGSFINLIYACTAQLAGAIGTPEFLMFFDYFARKDLGDNYLEDHNKEITQYMQQVIYGINQPTARTNQSVFLNVAIYDKPFFESVFENFVFPDGEPPSWGSLFKLQEYFLKFMRVERTKKLLTFPVITAHVLNDGTVPIDDDTTHLLALELSLGNSFFIYTSDTADALASCCRLRNELTDNIFSSTLGAGGVSTGSLNVITMNMNRIIQKNIELKEQVLKIHKYQLAYKAIIQQYYDAGLLDIFSGGFLNIKKMFLTVGINGLVEGAESLGYTVGTNNDYIDFISSTLQTIYETNMEGRKNHGVLFNSECVPAESLGCRLYEKDKNDGLQVDPNRNCYNSYFYLPDDPMSSIVDKFVLQGGKIAKSLDGGSALHLNLMEHPSYQHALDLINLGIKTGNQFWCINVRSTHCQDCEFITNETKFDCPNCGSKNLLYGTRVIGYWKLESHFSEQRQIESNHRAYI